MVTFFAPKSKLMSKKTLKHQSELSLALPLNEKKRKKMRISETPFCYHFSSLSNILFTHYLLPIVVEI